MIIFSSYRLNLWSHFFNFYPFPFLSLLLLSPFPLHYLDSKKRKTFHHISELLFTFTIIFKCLPITKISHSLSQQFPNYTISLFLWNQEFLQFFFQCFYLLNFFSLFTSDPVEFVRKVRRKVILVRTCIFVCLCVCDRKRERESERDREKIK